MSAFKVITEIEKNNNTYVLSKSSYEVLETFYSVSIYDSDMNRLNAIHYNTETDARQGLERILQEGV